jgi:ABC-type spermidine/putrescine transport system permease subunit II
MPKPTKQPKQNHNHHNNFIKAVQASIIILGIGNIYALLVAVLELYGYYDLENFLSNTLKLADVLPYFVFPAIAILFVFLIRIIITSIKSKQKPKQKFQITITKHV